jgi:hypothetical protein
VTGEDHPVSGLRSLVRQVGGDGLPGGFGQWHRVFTPALGPAQGDRAGVPVDVVHAQACNLAAAQAQVEHAAHHRIRTQHRQMRHRRFAAARIAGGIAAIRKDWR